jgi:hypothetical protein
VKLNINGKPVIQATYSRAYWDAEKELILHRSVYKLLSSTTPRYLIHYHVDNSLEKNHSKEYPDSSILYCVSRLLFLMDCSSSSAPPAALPSAAAALIAPPPHGVDDFVFDPLDILVDAVLEGRMGAEVGEVDDGDDDEDGEITNIEGSLSADDSRDSADCLSSNSGGSTNATGSPFLSPEDCHHNFFPSSPMIGGMDMSVMESEGDDDQSGVYHHHCGTAADVSCSLYGTSHSHHHGKLYIYTLSISYVSSSFLLSVSPSFSFVVVLLAAVPVSSNFNAFTPDYSASSQSGGKISRNGPVRRYNTKRGHDQINAAAPSTNTDSVKTAAVNCLVVEGESHPIRDKEEDEDGSKQEKKENDMQVKRIHDDGIDTLITQVTRLTVDTHQSNQYIPTSCQSTEGDSSVYVPPIVASSTSGKKDDSLTSSSSFFSRFSSSITSVFRRKKSETCISVCDNQEGAGSLTVVDADKDKEASVEDSK